MSYPVRVLHRPQSSSWARNADRAPWITFAMNGNFDQLYDVAEVRVTCLSTFFISTVSCALVLSCGAITNWRSSNIEYSIEIKNPNIWLLNYSQMHSPTQLVNQLTESQHPMATTQTRSSVKCVNGTRLVQFRSG